MQRDRNTLNLNVFVRDEMTGKSRVICTAHNDKHLKDLVARAGLTLGNQLSSSPQTLNQFTMLRASAPPLLGGSINQVDEQDD